MKNIFVFAASALSVWALISNNRTEQRLVRLFERQVTWNRVTGQSVEALLKEQIRQINDRGIASRSEIDGAVSGVAVSSEIGGKAISGK